MPKENNSIQGAEITPAWIRSEMERLNVKVGDIERETGANQSNISQWIHDRRNMSAPVKAMFKFYFLFKENES